MLGGDLLIKFEKAGNIRFFGQILELPVCLLFSIAGHVI